MSTIASGRSSAASTSASAITSRPSASVLMTSTVVPPRIVMTSPSLIAVPGRHVVGAHQVAGDRRSGSRARRSASSPRGRAGARHVVLHRRRGRRRDGLRLMPPESYMIPLPTSASVRGRPVALAGAGRRVRELDHPRLVGAAAVHAEEPAAAQLEQRRPGRTPRPRGRARAPMPRRRRPCAGAVRWAGGVLARSRASDVAAARIRPALGRRRSTASRSAGSATSVIDATRRARRRAP